VYKNFREVIASACVISQSLDCFLVTPPSVNQDGYDPACDEEPDDRKAQCGEVLVETQNDLPEPAPRMKPLGQQAQRFYSAHKEGDHDRYKCDRHVVVELSNGLDERPAISAQHENVIRGVDEAHAGGEERRENQNRANRNALGRLGRGYLYLVFYLKRAVGNDAVTFGFGVTATVALTLIWDLPHPTEAHLISTFSLSFVVMLGTLVAMAVAWVFLQFGHAQDPPPVGSRVRIFVPDAFSNPEYGKFALKGCLAGLLCYVLDSSVAWPVIMGACAETCIVAARPLSAGAGTRNERLFVSITALSGVVFGFGSHGLLLPYVDSVTGFLLQFAVIAALAAWVATSSPRLAYAGTLGAMGFFFPMVQRFAPNPRLARSGAFMLDLVLALLAFWLVLDGASDRQASPESAQFV